MKILEVSNLCKNYGKGSTLVKALDDISFSIDEGDFVAIVGASGSGKSTSLRNLPAEETAIINITNKPMPFRNKDNKKIVCLKDFNADSYDDLYKQIIKAIQGTKKRIVVVDDSSYMMSFENFEKANVKSYDKFTTMAKNYYDLIKGD